MLSMILWILFGEKLEADMQEVLKKSGTNFRTAFS